MRIAVTYENGEVFQHFGHTEQFKIYEVKDGQIQKEEIVNTNGSGHGALSGFLTGHGVDTLLCGGIGGGAREALDAAGIRLYGGISGTADDAVKAFLDGTLAWQPDVQCSHHEHGGHDDGGCGHGNCGGSSGQGQENGHAGCGEDKHGCAGNGGRP